MTRDGGEPAGFVAQRRFGDVEVGVIDVGKMSFTPADNEVLLGSPSWSWDAVTEPDGRAVLGVNVFVVRTPDATIVVDPCTFDPDELQVAFATIHPGAHMDDGLAALGIDPADVTHVVSTHLHEDHFVGLLDDEDGLRFPNALHILPAADWDTIIVPGNPYVPRGEDLKERLPLTGEPGGALLVDGEHEVSPGVTVLPTPGETEGHQIVRVQTPEGRVYVLGDLVHWAAELEDPQAMSPISSPTEIRRAFLAEADEEPATLLFTHADFPAFGRLAPTGGDRRQWRDA